MKAERLSEVRDQMSEVRTNLYKSNPLNQYTNIACSVGSMSQSPQYDSDGNLTNYNGWTYSWNGENRLIMASNGNTVVTFAYDYMGRRFRKIVHDGTTATTNYYVYDGWNLIQELTYSQTHTLTNYYTWGLDLSGSLQGAGGIGGLLSCSSRSASGTETYYPVADGNGNITEYVTTNGTIAAHYEYNPFGGAITSSGTKVNDFHFRFSSKYFDDETGLYNYGLRDLDVELGRWISRDPIGKDGGINIYGFVGNAPLSDVDALGFLKAADWEIVNAVIETWQDLGWIFAPRLANHSLAMGKNRSAPSDEIDALKDHKKFKKKFNDKYFKKYACKKGVGIYADEDIVAYAKDGKAILSDIGSAYGHVRYRFTANVSKRTSGGYKVYVKFKFNDTYDFNTGDTLNPVHAFDRLQKANMASIFKSSGEFTKDYEFCCGILDWFF